MKITIATNRLDSDNDRINISGVQAKDRVILTMGFDPSEVIGYCSDLKEENGELTGTLTLSSKLSEEQANRMFPAIGFSSVRSTRNDLGGFDFDEINLLEVSLSTNPNADPNIKSIGEQLASKK